jgi:hypothetical protein
VTAVLLALTAALAFAVSTVVEHRAATEVSAGEADLRVVRLVTRLLRHRAWLAAQGAGALGVGLHGAALRAGRLVVVQPLLSGGIVLALGIGALVDRRHADRRLPDGGQWAAAAVLTGGLTVFLLTARPAAGAGSAPVLATTGCALGWAVVAGAAGTWGRTPGRRHRAPVLGAAAGLGFGVAGLLLKELMGLPLPGWPAVCTVTEFCAVGLAATVLSQWAFQAGPLIASLPLMTVLEPAVAVLLSGPLFAEWLAPGLLARTGQLAGALAAAVGIACLVPRMAPARLPAGPPAGVARPSSGTVTAPREPARVAGR